MNLVRVMEVALLVLLMVFLTMQIIMPLWNGRPMFPMFRKQAKLEKELARAKQEEDEEVLEQTLNEIKRK